MRMNFKRTNRCAQLAELKQRKVAVELTHMTNNCEMFKVVRKCVRTNESTGAGVETEKNSHILKRRKPVEQISLQFRVEHCQLRGGRVRSQADAMV